MITTTKELFTNYKIQATPAKHRSERGDLISYFTEKINAGRVSTQYKPISIQNMAHLLSIYNVEQLYSLRIKCDQAKSFSKTFWWYVKNLSNNGSK